MPASVVVRGGWLISVGSLFGWMRRYRGALSPPFYVSGIGRPKTRRTARLTKRPARLPGGPWDRPDCVRGLLGRGGFRTLDVEEGAPGGRAGEELGEPVLPDVADTHRSVHDLPERNGGVEGRSRDRPDRERAGEHGEPDRKTVEGVALVGLRRGE